METTENFYRFSRYYRTLGPFLAKTEVKVYTTIILSFLTMSFFGYFAIKPTFTTIASLNKQIQDEKLVDRKLQEKINALSLAQDEYQKSKPDLDLIYASLPKTAEFPSFVKSLEKIATDSGLQIINLGFKTINLSDNLLATQSSVLVPIDFDLTVQGDYPKIDLFLNKITGLARLTVIDKMGFSIQKNSLTVVLSGQVFYTR